MGTLRSGDAFASPLPATLSQRQLYPTNNLLPKSVSENSPFASTYSEYLAGVECGVDDMSKLAEIFGRSRGAYTPVPENLKQKVDEYEWVEEEGLVKVINEL